MNTYSRLTAANNSKSGSLAKLSSGLRINKAGDDAAGLAISEKMRGQIGGLKQATRNAQDAISLIQTAEGGLNETHSILNRMRDLAVQSANDTNTNEDRKNIQDEMNQLTQEIDRIAADTQFNGKNLLSGQFANNAIKFQIGANAEQDISLKIADMKATGVGSLNLGSAATVSASVKEIAVVEETNSVLATKGDVDISSYSQKNDLDIKIKAITAPTAAGVGEFDVTINGVTKKVSATTAATDGEIKLDATSFDIFETGQSISIKAAADWSANDEYNIKVTGKTDEVSGPDVSTFDKAKGAISAIDVAIGTVSAERSKLGATQNRLDHTINNLTATAENLSEAESRIRDVDMAEEMMEFTKSNILSQAATSMLAQANQMPQGVLQLLQ